MCSSKSALGLVVFSAALLLAPLGAMAADTSISGDYLETRTCDIYTGPCFANGQVGLTGQDAMMAWSIAKGSHDGVDLAGLKVVVAIRASDTLGLGGNMNVNPDPIKSVIMVDQKATARQREALIDFARTRAGKLIGQVMRVDSTPIEMSVDHEAVVGKLKAGKNAELVTRKVREGDCKCGNELVFYPPLASMVDYEPAVTVEGQFSGPGLGSRWSNPETRSSFVAWFAY